MNNKEKIIAKIKALLDKTMDSGCTEHEAMQAAAKASELMLKYDLEDSDIDSFEKEEFIEKTIRFAGGSSRRKSYHPVQHVIWAIGHFTDTKPYHLNYGLDLTFFGTEKDVEIAFFLLDLFKNAMDYQYKIFQKSSDFPKNIHGKTVRASFMRGMAGRLTQRLKEMKKERENSFKEQTGTGLIVLKGKIVEEKFFEAKGKMKTKQTSRYTGNMSAMLAGRKAANNVNITSGISGNSNQKNLLK